MKRAWHLIAGTAALAAWGTAPAAAQPSPAATASTSASSNAPAEQAPFDLRVTFSSFFYREVGDDAPALVDQGAARENASPVRRAFGDLRLQLDAAPLTLDVRARQTGARRYQSGATGASEYEVRELAVRVAASRTELAIGRQTLEAAGAAKLDGLAVTRSLGASLAATVFAGALPARGSRSVDTDYVGPLRADGTRGAIALPVAAGLGVIRRGPNLHGDLGALALYAPASDGVAGETSGVRLTSSGYGRLLPRTAIYHNVALELASGRAAISNASLGADLEPIEALRLAASVHHVESDLLAQDTRDRLADPDPAAMPFVTNAAIASHVVADAARASASLALAQRRFELSVGGALRQRPAIDVALADGTGALRFPASRSAEGSVHLLDRRSLAGTRLSVGVNVITPLGSSSPRRASATLVRLAASRGFADDSAQIELDVLGERVRDQNESACAGSLDPLSCYGRATTTELHAGAVASWRAARQWLVLLDVHGGYRAVRSSSMTETMSWPSVLSLTGFFRLQWSAR